MNKSWLTDVHGPGASRRALARKSMLARGQHSRVGTLKSFGRAAIRRSVGGLYSIHASPELWNINRLCLEVVDIIRAFAAFV